MKILALTIGGDGSPTIPVQLPGQITTVNNHAGIFGSHILQLSVALLFLAATLLSLLYVFFGGIKWLVSQGDKKNIEDARNTIVYAIIGLVISLTAFLVINVLGTFFHIPILRLQ